MQEYGIGLAKWVELWEKKRYSINRYEEMGVGYATVK
jgi:hypothetical protein